MDERDRLRAVTVKVSQRHVGIKIVCPSERRCYVGVGERTGRPLAGEADADPSAIRPHSPVAVSITEEVDLRIIIVITNCKDLHAIMPRAHVHQGKVASCRIGGVIVV